MTLFPTHISLEGLLFWTFLSPKDKEYFKENKLHFWVIILFTIIPDFDVFFGIHRGISHSLLSPLLLVGIGTIIYSYFKYWKLTEHSSRNSSWGKFVLFCGLLWMTHIFLDLEYPLAIFYPLSDRLYQINFSILIVMIPWFFLPVGFSGIGLDISSVSYLRGIASYFVNLPVKERVELYGTDPVPLFIEDYLIHFLLFLIFLFIVARPMSPKVNLTQITAKYDLKQPDKTILGLGSILIIIGLLMGPFIGTTTFTTDSISSHFQVSESVFSPIVAITFDSTNYLLQPNALETIHTSLTIDQNPPFNSSLVLTHKQDYLNFVSEVYLLFQTHPLNTSDNIATFETSYLLLKNNLFNNTIEINHTIQNESKLYTRLPRGSYAIMGLINDWNSSLLLNGTVQSASVRLELEVTSNREMIYFLGISFIVSGIIIAYFSIKVNNKKSKVE